MIELIREKLLTSIGERRYNHSIGVMETAVNLASIYNYDVDKARLAGLLHDCAKFKDPLNLLKRVNDFGIILDDIMYANNELIHGPLGAKIAEFEYGVKDSEILNAIKYHTTGRENMTLLEKIIYIADYIEPGRDFFGIESIRNLAKKDLDKSVRISMDNTLKYLIEKHKLIHPDTLKSRNYLLLKEKSEINV